MLCFPEISVSSALRVLVEKLNAPGGVGMIPRTESVSLAELSSLREVGWWG